MISKVRSVLTASCVQHACEHKSTCTSLIHADRSRGAWRERKQTPRARHHHCLVDSLAVRWSGVPWESDLMLCVCVFKPQVGEHHVHSERPNGGGSNCGGSNGSHGGRAR